MQLCAGPRADEVGGEGPTKGAAGPRRARGAVGKAAAWTWAQAGNTRLGVPSLTHHVTLAGPGRLGWLKSLCLLLEITVETPGGMVRAIVNPLISIFFKGHQVQRRRPWAISKRRHLDSSNLWCGRYRCSPGLTSLFGK